MTDLFTWMTDNNVKLQPVLVYVEKKIVVLHWSAGFVVLAGDKFRNIVQTLATGDTPLDALKNLRNGIYEIRDGVPVKK